MVDVVPIFLRVRRADIAYIKFVVESYEGLGIVRTLDRHAAIIVMLVTPDFEPTARELVTTLRERLPCEEIAWPPQASEDWLLRPDPDDTVT